MEIIVTILKFLGYGVLGLFGLLVVAVVIFGKRIRKEWEYEAEFRDASGRQFGELEIESSRIEKKEPDYTFKAKFYMRHPSLMAQQTVQVTLDDVVVLEGVVQEDGRVRLRQEHIRNVISNPEIGQVCNVVRSGQVLFTTTLARDD